MHHRKRKKRIRAGFKCIVVSLTNASGTALFDEILNARPGRRGQTRSQMRRNKLKKRIRTAWAHEVPDFVKIRWLGPTQIVMKEDKADIEGQQHIHLYIY